MHNEYYDLFFFTSGPVPVLSEAGTESAVVSASWGLSRGLSRE